MHNRGSRNRVRLAKLWPLAALALMVGLSAKAATEKVIATVPANIAGGLYGGVTLDSSHNIYGTVLAGGRGAGGVYKLTYKGGTTWTPSVLFWFNGTDGAGPTTPHPIFDSKGNLYGTTTAGGSGGYGTVFRLTPAKSGQWTETLLYNFTGHADGGAPYGGVATDNHGNLYGTTNAGGDAVCNCGVVYELSPTKSGEWTETILHTFLGQPNDDGQNPYYCTPAFDANGNLFGTAEAGNTDDFGNVWELSPAGNGNWNYQIVLQFPGGNGGNQPLGGVVVDGSGNLYGTANNAVFELVKSSGYAETTIHVWGLVEGQADGGDPYDAGVLDSAGNLYVTTESGYFGYPIGTVVEFSPAGNGNWTENILFGYPQNGQYGANPIAPPTLDSAGNVFATTANGGGSQGNQGGTVLGIKP
jgi:uncharacterized repeat protein (TIGR03803 family)